MELAPFNLDPSTRSFYVRTLAVLNESRVPYLVGGTFAVAQQTGIDRHTKDLDIFLRRADLDGALATLSAAGYRTEVTFPHWLAKASSAEGFVDFIFNSGNGLSAVDDEWFAHASAAEILGVPVRLCPAEEMIWSKSYVQERERFDGADVVHLILTRGHAIDWHRLVARFGDHWRILFSHLINFGFIYPSERGRVPAWVLREFSGRLAAETDAPAPEGHVCRGTLLSREQYLVDTGRWDFQDARVRPLGAMTPEAVAHWTAAIAESKAEPGGH